jgi:hypothetical protein
MPELIYRVVAVCGALGYGYPAESLKKACEGRIDAVISDAGSMDAGPYYLGTGTEYFERSAVKADFTSMVQAAAAKDAPLILGSSGMAGGDRNLAWMVDLAKEVFAEQDVAGWKVATISSELDPARIVQAFDEGHLRSLGEMPALTADVIAQSTVVGQMGIHPLITALEEGARCILAGRACDIALYASDMIRRGIDPGIAYHVGHVLECGALACDPGSPSDCLVAEVYDDGTARFVAPNEDRACRPYSIAAHSLYEESHPALQFYPEGVLCMEQTEFIDFGDRVTGIRGSVFAHTDDLTIKLEGVRHVGKRRISLVHIDAADLAKVPSDLLAYGRNGVEVSPVAVEGEREVGILIETRADDAEAAETLASLLTHYLIHYGYPGRKATAGNVAYPMSPNLASFRRDDGSYGAVVVQGTRDPVFLENFDSIQAAVIELIADEFPDALRAASYTITAADADRPVVLVRTVDEDAAQLAERHTAAVAELTSVVHVGDGSLLDIDTPDLYEWTLFHLIDDRELIEGEMFPVRFHDATGADWRFDREVRPRYFDIGVRDYAGDTGERTLSVIEPVEHARPPMGTRPLRDLAVVIRTKDAGINRLTYDIVFNSPQEYALAIRSNAFTKAAMAAMLGLDEDRVVGTFRMDACNAIKVSIDRPIVSASATERDVFGAQQQAELILLHIPAYSDPAISAGAI